MNKYELEMLELMEEQGEIIKQIESTKDKTPLDLFKLYSELVDSCKDIQTLFKNLL